MDEIISDENLHTLYFTAPKASVLASISAPNNGHWNLFIDGDFLVIGKYIYGFIYITYSGK